MSALTVNLPPVWCAICGTCRTATGEHYTCPICADPAIDVPKPVKQGARIPVIPGPTAISRLAAGFAAKWAGAR